ncbi:serine incorporator domain-containing protein, partial [Dehalococcoidia bacterium]|nr:serine incorporator domain-containing protein [Dehalococcoidia bacterium]
MICHFGISRLFQSTPPRGGRLDGTSAFTVAGEFQLTGNGTAGRGLLPIDINQELQHHSGMAYCTPLIFSAEVNNPDMQHNGLLLPTIA